MRMYVGEATVDEPIIDRVELSPTRKCKSTQSESLIGYVVNYERFGRALHNLNIELVPSILSELIDNLRIYRART